jgi:hypothetical protein
LGPYAELVSPTESAASASRVKRTNEISDRKRLGAWYTPDQLIAVLIERTIQRDWVDTVTHQGTRVLRVLDPACGDGRLLEAAGAQLNSWGVKHQLIGVDIDPEATRAARQRLGAKALIIDGDALGPALLQATEHGPCDLLVANPPFISQMSAQTTRGGSSQHGGGPYADVAAEFCALALSVTSPDHGRIALILPQSLLTARDAGPIRARMDNLSRPLWDWHSDGLHFDAAVRICAIGRELLPTNGSSAHAAPTAHASGTWGHLLALARGVPEIGALHTDGVIGDRADLNANFRDQYYGLVPAVRDSNPNADSHQPPFITTGLIDPGVCHWGSRPARFAKQNFAAPRVDLTQLDPAMTAWAKRKLVPKVLVATQTQVIEAVADPTGAWLPGVPITSVVPKAPGATAVWEIAAVLTSPVATLAAWWSSAGSGLSARSLRISPRLIALTPWPKGDIAAAVHHFQAGRIADCGREMAAAYDMDPAHPGIEWWLNSLRPES